MKHMDGYSTSTIYYNKALHSRNKYLLGYHAPRNITFTLREWRRGYHPHSATMLTDPGLHNLSCYEVSYTQRRKAI